MTRRGTGFATSMVGIPLVMLLVGCSSDEDEPPSSSLLKAIADALCESGQPSIPINGTIYSLSDCDTVP